MAATRENHRRWELCWPLMDRGEPRRFQVRWRVQAQVQSTGNKGNMSEISQIKQTVGGEVEEGKTGRP